MYDDGVEEFERQQDGETTQKRVRLQEPPVTDDIRRLKERHADALRLLTHTLTTSQPVRCLNTSTSYKRTVFTDILTRVNF